MKLQVPFCVLALATLAAGQLYTSRNSYKSDNENNLDFNSYDVLTADDFRHKPTVPPRFKFPQRQKPNSKIDEEESVEEHVELKKEDSKEEEKSTEKVEATTAAPSFLARTITRVRQLPGNMLRALTGFVSSARPIARLREEMKNLDIKYPGPASG